MRPPATAAPQQRSTTPPPAESAEAPHGLLLLAAGASRRFGTDKRRHRLADGRTLLEASVHCYVSAFSELLVVLRPEEDELAESVRAAAGTARVRTVTCAESHLGMGHSLACGARALPRRWRFAFVALADMAWVRPQTLERLRETMAAAGPAAIVQPTCAGEPGHPVGFGAAWFAALETLQGDVGARPLLRRAGPSLRRLEVADPGILQDLDQPPA